MRMRRGAAKADGASRGLDVGRRRKRDRLRIGGREREPREHSAGEDVAAVGLTWFATAHPYIAVAVVAVALVLLVVFIRWLIRAMKRLFRGARDEVRRPAAEAE